MRNLLLSIRIYSCMCYLIFNKYIIKISVRCNKHWMKQVPLLLLYLLSFCVNIWPNITKREKRCSSDTYAYNKSQHKAETMLHAERAGDNVKLRVVTEQHIAPLEETLWSCETRCWSSSLGQQSPNEPPRDTRLRATSSRWWADNGALSSGAGASTITAYFWWHNQPA